MSPPPQLATWDEWLAEIKNQVTWLLIDRHIFRETRRVVKDNPATHSPNDFVQWCIHQYASSAGIRVRNQVDRDSRAVSLWRLLEDVKANAPSITRAWYVSRYEPRLQTSGEADRCFDAWSGVGVQHVDAQVVERHQEDLVNACGGIKKYVDKRVAHRDRVPQSELSMPNSREFDRAIDVVDELACRCIELVEGPAYSTLLPTWCYDWQTVFEKPWKPACPNDVRATE